MSYESEYYFRTKNRGTRIAQFVVLALLVSGIISGIAIILGGGQ